MKAKNIRLLEEGFDKTYHNELRRRSIERAARWTRKRFEFELKIIEVLHEVLLF